MPLSVDLTLHVEAPPIEWDVKTPGEPPRTAERRAQTTQKIGVFLASIDNMVSAAKDLDRDSYGGLEPEEKQIIEAAWELRHLWECMLSIRQKMEAPA